MKKIRLIFTKDREVFTIEIQNKIIVYKDRKQPTFIQFMPRDPEIEKKVLFSRNRIPKYILDLINDANTGKNLIEYQSAQDDESLVPIVKRDALTRACLFQKREDIEVN